MAFLLHQLMPVLHQASLSQGFCYQHVVIRQVQRVGGLIDRNQTKSIVQRSKVIGTHFRKENSRQNKGVENYGKYLFAVYAAIAPQIIFQNLAIVLHIMSQHRRVADKVKKHFQSLFSG